MMKLKTLFSIFLLSFSVSIFSQVETKTQTETKTSVATTYSPAEFPGGRAAFKKEFMRMVYAYVDTQAYAVNGKFSFLITIDKNGKMTELKSYPRVKNDVEFIQDMTFALNRIKKRWKPEYRDGKPVESKVVVEINFTTEHANHEF